MITSSERILSKKSSILILSSVLILIIILLAYLYYTISSEDIKHEKQNDLEAISKLKIGQFTQWHFERTGDVKIMSTSPVFVNMVAAWLNNRNDDKSLKNIIEQLEITRKNYEYENIFLASTNAELLCAAIDNLEKLDPITKGKILEAQEKNNLTYSDFYYCPTHNKIHYDILAPIYNKGLIIANLVFRVDPSVYLYPLIKTWPYSSKSAESILIRKDGDSVLFLNELRHQKNTALKFRLPLSRKDLPAVQAASGRIGIFEGVDYRGVEVLAYLNSVPGTNWFVVVKMDRSEIYAELNFRQSIIALIAGLLLILILIGLISIYYQRQNTVFKKLWEEQEKFRTTLYSIGDAVIVTDINSKVKHLNLTAERLTGWKEKDAINKPLEDVFKIINEENRVGIQDPVQRILSHGSDFELADQILLVSKNGTETPISESVATIRNEKNEIDGAVIVFQDQSKIRETQKIIQKNEIIVRSILDNLPVGISVNSTDSTKPFKYMNNNYSKFFDAPAEALRDQSKIWDTVFEDEALRQIMKRKMIADVESGDPNRMHWEDIPITKSGKEIRFVSVKSIPIPENNLILSTVMDVTDRKL
ncbi:MAG: PAS domain S-box protein, partial [Ignavibacteriaceae bacterium]|nr:PAS domain S-box protein [Ignavibacteriaceae bacterium]